MPASVLTRALHRRPSRIDAIVVFAVAFGLRIGLLLLSRGGHRGIVSYDPGVYYAAGDALIHGRLPYADFVLLHPPGVMLAVAPFAALGRLTTDPIGFIAANTAFEVVGAVNAVLVWLVARQLGCRRRAALVGALFYAIWFGVVTAEATVRLEPVGSCAFLLALVALTGPVPLGRRRALLAGMALAGACSVKIWWVVPIVVVIAGQVRDRDRRPALGWVVAGAGLLALVVDGPFVVAAPRAMWRMVVTDQLGRPSGTSLVFRLSDVTGLRAAFPTLTGSGQTVALFVVAGLVVAAGVVAWRLPAARLIVLVLIAQVLVLGASPSYFLFYAGYPAAALALVVAAAEQSRGTARLGRRVPIAWATVLTAAVISGVALLRPILISAPFPASRLTPVADRLHCLETDSPVVLIQLNALSRNLADHCPNWIDVTGRTYDVDTPPGHRLVARSANPRWQRDLYRYLSSGDGVIVVRAGTGYSRATLRVIARHRVLGRAGPYIVYATTPERRQIRRRTGSGSWTGIRSLGTG